MSDFLFQVDIEQVYIYEFCQDLESCLQEAEVRIISLKQCSAKEDLLFVKAIFTQLNMSSSKLNLIPLTESFSETTVVLEKVILWEHYPENLTEFLLLLMDRILYLVRQVERNLVIDLRETQNILISLQHIILLDQSSGLGAAITKALQAITQNISLNTVEFDSNSVDLFETEITQPCELSDDPPKSNNEDVLFDIFTPKSTIDPLLYAKDVSSSILQDESMALLTDISDMTLSTGGTHSRTILELGLAINYMAGENIDVEGLAKGLCLHDIGMSHLHYIVSKPGKLTQEELQLIRQHPIKGASLAKTLNIHNDGCDVIAHHHERLDGKGYPHGLKADQISEGGKLSAIVDSFCAMIESRSHKKVTRSALRAIAELNACSNSHFSPYWIKQFNIFMKQHWFPLQRELILKSKSNRQNSSVP